MDVSFNLIKERDSLLQSLCRLRVLSNLDTRNNVFNSQYYMESARGQTEYYRQTLIYNFAQTAAIIDGVEVTAEERSRNLAQSPDRGEAPAVLERSIHEEGEGMRDGEEDRGKRMGDARFQRQVSDVKSEIARKNANINDLTDAFTRELESFKDPLRRRNYSTATKGLEHSLVAHYDIPAEFRTVSSPEQTSSHIHSEAREDKSLLGLFATEMTRACKEEIGTLKSELDQAIEEKRWNQCGPAQDRSKENEPVPLRAVRGRLNEVIRRTHKEKPGDRSRAQDVCEAPKEKENAEASFEGTMTRLNNRVSMLESQIIDGNVEVPDSSTLGPSHEPNRTAVSRIAADTEHPNDNVASPTEKLAAIFSEHARGAESIPASAINSVARAIIGVACGLPRPASDIIVDLTMAATRRGEISLSMLLAAAGLVSDVAIPTLVVEQSLISKRRKAKPSRHPMSKSQTKVGTERAFLEMMLRFVTAAYSIQGCAAAKTKDEHTGIVGMFARLGFSAERVVGVKGRDAMFRDLPAKVTKRVILYYAGGHKSFRKLIAGEHVANLVFADRLETLRRSVPTDEREVALLAAVELGVCGKLKTRPKHREGVLGRNGSVYFEKQGLYLIRDVGQICPLYLVEFRPN